MDRCKRDPGFVRIISVYSVLLSSSSSDMSHHSAWLVGKWTNHPIIPCLTDVTAMSSPYSGCINIPDRYAPSPFIRQPLRQNPMEIVSDRLSHGQASRERTTLRAPYYDYIYYIGICYHINEGSI